TRGQTERANETERDVSLTEVTLSDEHGPTVEVETNGKLRVTVKAQARKRHEDMSVVIQVVDDHQYGVFDTCTQRLGAGALTLEAGETLECTFELDVVLAEGTFHVNAFLHRYLTDLPYDTWRSAATFFVAGVPEARGVVTMHPRLTSCKIGTS